MIPLKNEASGSAVSCLDQFLEDLEYLGLGVTLNGHILERL